MPEPTSALTFHGLILEVARKLGCGYYGENGDEAIQIPVDAHDLDLCKRIVNKAIRMFIADSPAPNGWRWARPVASVTVWGRASGVVTAAAYDALTGKTLLTNGEDAFYESMEGKPLVLESGTYTIVDYVSPTQIRVAGDASAAVGEGWSVTPDGNYTLPRSFGGQFTGAITFAAGTNRGLNLEWCDEAVIRQWREDITDETGDPYLAAVRVMASGTPRRRWELCLYPKPDEALTVEFPYHLSFDSLVDLDEVPPTPFSHDETIRAACLAVAERDEDDTPGPDWDYYRNVALPNSHKIDAMSAPRRLGYFGDPSTAGVRGSGIQTFRNLMYQRPRVTFNP